VDVLDQVIPTAPFPDDLAGRRAGGLDLHQAIWLKMRILHGLGAASLSDRFFFGDLFPADEQRVSIGELDRVVMGHAFFSVILEIPDDVAIPIQLLNPSRGRRSLETGLAIGRLGGPKEVAIVEQISGGAAAQLARPAMNDAPVVVEQVRYLPARVNQ